MAAIIDDHVPALQLMQNVAPVTLFHVPALQFVHVLDPDEDHVPALQLIHTAVEVEAVKEDHVPALQLRQKIAPFVVDHVPALQLVH